MLILSAGKPDPLAALVRPEWGAYATLPTGSVIAPLGLASVGAGLWFFAYRLKPVNTNVANTAPTSSTLMSFPPGMTNMSTI